MDLWNSVAMFTFQFSAHKSILFKPLGNQTGRYTTSSGEIYEGSYDNTSRKNQNPIYKKNTYFYVPR